MRLIAYMCPSSLEIDISSSFFLHFWQGDSRKYQDLALAACSVTRKSDQGATNSEFCWMQGPGIECGLSIGFDAFLLSFSTNRMLLFTVSLSLCPPGQNSGISNNVEYDLASPVLICSSLEEGWCNGSEQTLQRRPPVIFAKRVATWRKRVSLLRRWGRNAPASTSPTPFRLHFAQIKWRKYNAYVAFRNGADPIPDRKWGRSEADHILLCSFIGRAIRNSIEDSTLKRATCGPTVSPGFSQSFRN